MYSLAHTHGIHTTHNTQTGNNVVFIAYFHKQTFIYIFVQFDGIDVDSSWNLMCTYIACSLERRYRKCGFSKEKQNEIIAITADWNLWLSIEKYMQWFENYYWAPYTLCAHTLYFTELVRLCVFFFFFHFVSLYWHICVVRMYAYGHFYVEA